MGSLVQALLVGGATQLVLNLERVSYIDSAGLGAMVEAFSMARHKAVRLKLLNPTELVRAICSRSRDWPGLLRRSTRRRRRSPVARPLRTSRWYRGGLSADRSRQVVWRRFARSLP